MKKLSSINTLPEALSLFNLPQKFNIDDVNKRYRRLVLENHPDINQSGSSHEKMVDINQAKDLLLKFLENDQGKWDKDWQDQTIDFPGPVDEDESWQHQYYTPVSEYSDAEKFEYYTNPHIQKQYEQEFKDEQEFAQQDYEEREEREWEYEKDIINDGVFEIMEKLEKVDPKKLIDLFGRKVNEDELRSLNLINTSLVNKPTSKYEAIKNKTISKNFEILIDAAILEIISSEHPGYLKEIIINDQFSNVRDQLAPIGINSFYLTNIWKILPFNDFIELFNLGKASLRQLASRDEQEQLLFINNNWFNILKTLLDSNDLLNNLCWLSKDAKLLILDKLNTEETNKQINDIKNTINFLIKRGYFQGGGLSNEPTSHKKKYKSDPAIVAQPRFKEPFYRNYDYTNQPGEHGPGSGWIDMQNYKSIGEFLKAKRKKMKDKYQTDDSYIQDDGTLTKNKTALLDVCEYFYKTANYGK